MISKRELIREKVMFNSSLKHAEYATVAERHEQWGEFRMEQLDMKHVLSFFVREEILTPRKNAERVSHDK